MLPHAHIYRSHAFSEGKKKLSPLKSKSEWKRNTKLWAECRVSIEKAKRWKREQKNLSVRCCVRYLYIINATLPPIHSLFEFRAQFTQHFVVSPVSKLNQFFYSSIHRFSVLRFLRFHLPIVRISRRKYAVLRIDSQYVAS